MNRFLSAGAAALLGGILFAAPAQSLDFDMKIGLVLDGISAEISLSDKEKEELAPVIREQLEQGGTTEEVSAIVHQSLANGCRGTCLANTLRGHKGGASGGAPGHSGGKGKGH